MIKYKLICKSCKVSFDSWFASSKDYERLKKLKYINCQNCNSLNVEKNLMAPNILNSKKLDSEIIKKDKFKNVKNKLKEYQKFIKRNFEYVGENFAYEARSIHYKDKKKSKGIYGKATSKELKALKEEGIETEAMPWIDEKEN
ncbi:DUF1178 family protein [Candidatus Pelagibacter sp.]|nr:DUF1178 family protein [Candidatus Pelagibacter sp.]|tara:strand:- start:220 stop:648 length:429 start_codon:yes stop_codon:yes gene_type:complete